MRPFAAFERFFERIFERPAARLFHVQLQPVQLQHRIERAMEDERLTGVERTLVPNRYVVRLHPADLAAFGDVAPSLAAELADGALTYARAHRYTLVDRPQVALVPDPAVPAGEVRVASRFVGPSRGGAGPRQERAEAPPGEHGAIGGVDEAEPGEADSAEQPRRAGADAGEVGEPAAAGDWQRLGDDAVPVEQTRVFEVPKIRAPVARLRLIAPDGTQREVRVDGSLLTVGRARDNGLVLHDGRVSRYHARLQARSGSLVLTDLGSTNGTRVNGQLVEEVVLGLGDRVQLGDTTLVVESGPER